MRVKCDIYFLLIDRSLAIQRTHNPVAQAWVWPANDLGEQPSLKGTFAMNIMPQLEALEQASSAYSFVSK